MIDAARLERARAFQADPWAWTALHHFLPAGLLRELASATVAVFAPEHAFEDLFDDHLTGEGVLESWTIAPKPVEAEALRFLQNHIRVLVWANDSNTYPQMLHEKTKGHFAQGLAHALQLGRFDLGTESWTLEHLQFPEGSSARCLAEAMLAAATQGRGKEVVMPAIGAPLAELPMPLRVLAFKHLGDLCADVDAWDEAGVFYRCSDEACALPAPEAWSSLLRDVSDVVRQSLALVTWIQDGPGAAAPLLASAITSANSLTRLAVLNGSHEALVARLDADDKGSWADVRSSTLLPPLLLDSQDIEPAVRSWQTGDYDNAYRQFWGTLRRQVALGSYTDSRNTKALYGRALLSDVSGLQRSRFSPQTFELGVKLLIESGRPKGIETLSFSPDVVERYVSSDLVKGLAESADRHAGVRHLRSLVFIELLAKWAESAPRDKKDLAAAIMRELIARTAAFDAAFRTDRNIGAQGLKLLRRLASRRTDLRRPFGDDVADLIVQKLDARAWWTGDSEALELATAYADAFSPEALRKVLAAALQALQRTSPEEGFWPIVQPALRLLASEKALEVARSDSQLSPGYVSSLLRYGVAQRSAGVGLLLALSRFSGGVPLSNEDRAALELVLDEVRAGAKELSSSGVTDFIRALLVAAPHVGRSAIEEAIDSLVKILRSSKEERTSIGFPYAYGPVLDLLDSPNELLATGVSVRDLKERMSEVGKALVAAWEGILRRPELLANFSIPPEREPDPTLVHNWSFMTQRFVAEWGEGERLTPLIERAAALPQFASAMQRAALSSAAPDALEDGELERIETEGADAFYAAVGRRLRIAATDESARLALLETLVQRCLQLGPRELDVAIFMAATPWREALNIQIEGSDYIRQVGRDWQLRMNLDPYLRLWRGMF